MGTSGTESCERCLQTQFKHLLPQLALKLSLVRLKVTMKDPKKVEAGKRLAEYNRRKREERAQLAKAQSEPKLSQYYVAGPS